jgi:hypothetical protein
VPSTDCTLVAAKHSGKKTTIGEGYGLLILSAVGENYITHTHKSHIYIYLHIYLYYRLLELIYVSYPAKNEVFARVSIFSPVLVQFLGLNLLHRSHIIDTFESNSIKSVFKQLLSNPSQVDKLFAPSKQKMMI